MENKKIEEKLYSVKINPDNESHLVPNKNSCRNCKNKICTIICPANVYEWVAEKDELVVKYENCLECGACRIACEKQDLNWKYPKGNKGVTYKKG